MNGLERTLLGALLALLLAAGCGDDSGGDEPPDDDGADSGDGDAVDSGDGAPAGDGDGDGDTANGDGAGDGVVGNAADGTAAEVIECDNVVPDDACDDSLRPIVFIHGTFGSATEISKPALMFASNGYCADRFVAVEYNSLGGSPAADLAALIDETLERTGFDQVELMGHSQGTGHACSYLSDPDRRAKVANYVNLSGGCAGHGVPTLSISGPNDLGMSSNHASGDNVEQVDLVEEDHVAIAGSKNAFVTMWKYLYGEDPEYTTVQCGEEMVTLSGKLVTFGDNEPVGGGVVDFFEVDTLEDPRERGEPVVSVTVGDDGSFNFQVRRGVRYEVRVSGASGELLGYGYSSPFERSNYLTRFLVESMNPLVAASSTARVVRDPGHMVLVGRYIGGVFRPDWGNSLKIDGEEVLTAENAGPNASVVGLFMYDANRNGESELGSPFSFGFVQGTDVFIDATEPRWVDVEWTNEEGQTTELKVSNWPSSENMAMISLP